jgi:hypothetical protein
VKPRSHKSWPAARIAVSLSTLFKPVLIPSFLRTAFFAFFSSFTSGSASTAGAGADVAFARPSNSA